jgi:hypothetical protein
MALQAALVPLTFPCASWLVTSWKNIPRIQDNTNIYLGFRVAFEINGYSLFNALV